MTIFHLKCSLFSGDLSVAEEDPVILHYPTPGGLQVLNNAFLNWRRGDERRSY